MTRKSMKKRDSSSGGVAMHLGSEYQVRVAAWLAVEMLAEEQGRPIAPGGRISWLRGETQESMDDLLVGTVAGRFGFIQAKRSISFSDLPNSEFASVIDQAVRQFLSSINGSSLRPWNRDLVPSNDRLMLITTSSSGKNINLLLPEVLKRLANLAPGQQVNDAAVTQAQHKILQGLTTVLTNCWKSVTGRAPTDSEVIAVLSLLSIAVLDVESGQPGEREAMRTLSSVVIQDPDQQGAAWAAVLNACRKMMTERSGLNLASLRRTLVDDGIALRGVPSYRKDIEKLEAHSVTALGQLKDLSQIIVDGQPVQIERDAVHELAAIAEKSSYLITGHPGAGKSGALYGLAEILKTTSDVICLAADKLDVASLPALRTELGLEHELADIFTNWSGSRPGFLLIDALDAARGTRAAEALLALMRQVLQSESRWRVIACIRKFDLRYSSDLQELFSSIPGSFVDDRFVDTDFPFVPHVNVPLLSNEELAQLKSKAPALYNLYEKSTDALRQLLHVPFNLRLAATLLQSGMTNEDFAPIQTQIDLLDRYWDKRVIDATGGDDRESVLRQVLATMVSKRRLQVDRAAAAGPGLATALDQLLSRHVLTEWQPSPTATPDRRSLAFEHNFLFDFALAKLHLPSDTKELVRMLERDPDSVIVLRPSMALRLQQLWTRNRQLFWELAFEFAKSSNLSLIAQMTPMTTVAENAAAIDELTPLIDALDAQHPEDAEGARRAVRYLAGVLMSGRRENKTYAGTQAGPWCEMLEQITRISGAKLSGVIQALIENALLYKSELDSKQHSLIGISARRVFDMAWESPRRDGQMIIHALRTVCSTFDTDPDESAARIRRTLEPERVRLYGYQELHWLAYEVKELIPLDPELVADIFIAAFEWTEKDESPTPMTDSRILPMVSNKKQDHGSSRWHLTQHYQKLVRQSPSAAARAMIAVVGAYRREKDIANEEFLRDFHASLTEDLAQELGAEASLDEETSTPAIEIFSVDGVATALKHDGSSTGDSSHDEAVQIVRSFFQQLSVWADQEQTQQLAFLSVRFVIRHNQQAMIWRHLLQVLAKSPVLAIQLKQLAEAEPLLHAAELKDEFGSFLATLYPQLSVKERGALEDRILLMYEEEEGFEKAMRRRQVDSFLLALGDDDLVTSAARDRRAAHKAAIAASFQATEPFGGFFQAGPEQVDELYHRNESAEERIAQQRIRPFTQPVEEFGSKYLNGVPSLEEAETLLEPIQELVALIEGTPEPGLPEKVKDAVIATLAAACAKIALIPTLDCATGLGQATTKGPPPRCYQSVPRIQTG